MDIVTVGLVTYGLLMVATARYRRIRCRQQQGIADGAALTSGTR